MLDDIPGAMHDIKRHVTPPRLTLPNELRLPAMKALLQRFAQQADLKRVRCVPRPARLLQRPCGT